MRVLSRIFCGIALLGNSLSLSQAQIIPPFIPPLPAVRPAPKSVSLDLTGKLPKAYQKDPITVEIDASALASKIAPKLWLGTSLKGASAAPEFITKLGKTLTAYSAEFVRVNFAEGKPEDIIAKADALLPALKSAGLSVIVCLHPSGLAADLETTLKTLGASKYGIVRWECEGTWAELERNYAGFARSVRRIAPTSPVGIYCQFPFTDTPEAARFVHLLAANKTPCDSFAWSGQANAAKLTPQIQEARKLLAKYPALKGIILWLNLPDTVQGQTHSMIWDAVLPFVSGSLSNAVAGMTVGISTLFAAEELTQQGKELGLRQKLGGSLLKSPQSPAVRVVAAQDGKGILVYFAGTKTGNFVPHPFTLKIKNLPENPTGGWRLTRYDALSVVGDISTQKDKTKSVLRPVAVSDTASAAELELKTVLLSDSPVVLECRPYALPKITTVLSSDHLICRAGETINLDAFLTNAMPKAWSGKAELTGTLAGLITEGLRSVPTGVLTPNKPRLMRYQVKIPVTTEDASAFVNFAVNGVRSSLELRILAALKTAVMTPRLDLDAPGGTAEPRLFLVNRSQIDLPLSINANNEILPLILPKGKESVQTVPITLKERDAGVYPVAFLVDYGKQSLANLQVLIGVPYLCRYATLKPNIDGDLSEWTDAAPIGMGRQEQIRGKTWRGPTDLSAYAYAKWDESFFYFACAVTDDFIVPPNPEAIATTGDSVSFAVTPDPMLVNSEQGYGSSDMEFCFALAKDGQTNLVRTQGTNAHPAGHIDKAIVAIKRNGSRTFYEAAIPWQELGMTPPADARKFGFTVAVNDDDGEGRGAIVWSDGFFSVKRPFLFPPLRLIK